MIRLFLYIIDTFTCKNKHFNKQNGQILKENLLKVYKIYQILGYIRLICNFIVLISLL